PAPRRARVTGPPRGVADLPSAASAQGCDLRLSRPQPATDRPGAALHRLRRRLGRDGPATRRGREPGLRPSAHRAGSGDLSMPTTGSGGTIVTTKNQLTRDGFVGILFGAG